MKKEIVKIKYLKNGVYEKVYNDKTKEKQFSINLQQANQKSVKEVIKRINKYLYVLGMRKTMLLMLKYGMIKKGQKQ